LIIFTVTNKTTAQVYVGSTRNDLIDQWEKMVAAAEQNLDYPLYQEIRAHGRDGFTVEEWDYVDDRGELASLEQEALEQFNARSLKGYKTSTVKIQPKTKARRKSSIEKELASIFAEVVAESEDSATPPSLMAKKHPESEATTEKKTASSRKPSPAPKAISAQSVAKKVIETEPEEQSPAPASVIPDKCSQANAVVQMNRIDLSDEISAQLAAIQAAADAVISGDPSAANHLTQEAEIKQEERIETPTKAVVDLPEAVVKIPEPVIELDPKERRIREAIERHRKMRAQKNSEAHGEERNTIAKLLAELDAKALSLTQSVNIAA